MSSVDDSNYQHHAGERIGNYVLERPLGKGGFAEVWQAADSSANRSVAIKIFLDRVVHDPYVWRAIREEPKKQPENERIVPIYYCHLDSDNEPGPYYVVMKLMPSGTLDEMLQRRRRLPAEEAVAIIRDVLSGLEFAHNKGLIHRDIKPTNILFDANGRASLSDFGIAKDLNKTGQSTVFGTVLGTAAYMSHEQGEGQPVSRATDIYSVGAVLYEMLCGKVPFDGPSDTAIIVARSKQEPPPLRPWVSDVPERLEKVVLNCLERNLEHRYQDCGSLRRALDWAMKPDVPFAEPFVQPPLATKSSDIKKYGIFAAIAALLLAGIVFVLKGRKPAQDPSAATRTGTLVLRVHGSNTIGAELAPALVAAFLKHDGASDVKTQSKGPDAVDVIGSYPGESVPRVVEIQARGSATAFKDLGAGACDIGMASRKIKDSEAQSLKQLGDLTSPASEQVLGLDGIAVIVNRSNSISELSVQQISNLFNGTYSSWSSVGGTDHPIKVYARDFKSGTFDTFKELVLRGGNLVESAKRFEDSRTLSAAVASDPDGIGFIGLPYIGDAKPLAVSQAGVRPLLPTTMTVATEDYLLHRRLYLYNATNPKLVARSFVDFALSKEGQDIVAQKGFVSQNVTEETSNLSPGALTDYARLTHNANRLSLNFRFRSGSSDLDNKALYDIGRVVSFLADHHYTGSNVMLLGFADNVGSRINNIALSKERSIAVNRRLEQNGLSASLVTGLGSEMPVSSNETEEGRQNNRRVEIWVKTQ